MKSLTCLCMLLLGTSIGALPAAHAQDARLRDSYRQCAAKAQDATASQTCIDAEFRFQDARLNAAYRHAQASRSPTEKTALRDEERAWVAGKESSCRGNATVNGVSQNSPTNACILEKTAMRADQLEAMVKGAASTHAQPATRPATVSDVKDKGSKMDDLKAFATGGATILESVTGDLDADGRADALIVLDPPATGSEKLGEGPARDVVLLVRDASGQLRKVASNARVVPCANCGGIAGDPYGYTRVQSGQFTVVIGGGSREHWADEYTFRYSADKKDWLVDTVVRRVEDRDTGKKKQIDLTSRELGTVTFAAFDPSHLPEVHLP